MTMFFAWPLLLLLAAWIVSFSSRIVRKGRVCWGPQSCWTVLKLEVSALQAVTAPQAAMMTVLVMMVE